MLTSEEILQMKKVTDLICSAKKQIKYQIKVIFHLVFERDRHLMCTLYPPNVVKALEENSGSIPGNSNRKINSCSVLCTDLSGISIPWKLPGLWIAVGPAHRMLLCLLPGWKPAHLSVGSESPAVTPTYRTFYQSRICAATPNSQFLQSALYLLHYCHQHLLKDKHSAVLRANHISCFFPWPWKDF